MLLPRNSERNYQQGDILFYSRGSKEHEIEPRTYATVASIDAAANRITVATDDGKQAIYDSKRLRGITAYREISREDPQTNLYDREAQPISRENALEHAAHEPSHSVSGNAIVSSTRVDSSNDQGISL